MNPIERRQFARGQMIDASIAKAAVNRSRRQRAEAARKLEKAMAAKQLAAVSKSEMVAYPRHAMG